MIDLSLFEKVLAGIENGFIEPGDVIGVDVVEFLLRYPRQKCDLLFKKISGEFTIQGRCNSCPEIYTFTTSKTKTLKYLSDIRVGKKFICQTCGNKQAQEEIEKRKALAAARESEKANFEALKLERSNQFISTFLDVDHDPFTSGRWTNWKRMNAVKERWGQVDQDYVAGYIQGLEYGEFLRTPYWRSIAGYIKYRAGFKCSLCSSEYNLNTHHKTYQNHGREIDFVFEDFICLCNACHETFHAERKVV
jgi:hypothetical protein